MTCLSGFLFCIIFWSMNMITLERQILPSEESLVIRRLLPSSEPKNLIDLGQQEHFEGDLGFNPKHRNGILSPKRWPHGVIFYEIRGPYTKEESDLIRSVMTNIEQQTCIRFVQRSYQPDYVYIVNTEFGCFSEAIGRMGGPQKLSLQSSDRASCMSNAIIMHELLHVIGLWHEHMRFDRDLYVNINWYNIKSGLESQFQKIQPIESSVYNLQYDYYSIMHYNAYAFGSKSRGPTMVPKDTRFFRLIGNMKGPSVLDLDKVQRIYQCTLPPFEDPFGNFQCRNDAINCGMHFSKCRIWPAMAEHCKLTCGLCSIPVW